MLWQRLLGRPASESGRLCRGDRAQGRGAGGRWCCLSSDEGGFL